MFPAMGSAGIYRVRAPQNTYGNGANSSISELEHAVTEVGDWLIKREFDENMPASQAMQSVFASYGGNKWRLGDTSILGNATVSVSCDYDIVLEAMISLLGQTPEIMMDFDFSTRPWTINFKRRDSVVSAEGRLGRNVRTATITYDDSALCTRAYYECETTSGGSVDGIPEFNVNTIYSAGDYVNYNGKLYLLTEGHLRGVPWSQTVKSEVQNIPSSTWAYVDADTIGIWGIVERTVSTGDDYSKSEAMRVAADYVRKHKNPKLSIEISGAELSSITGEPLDTFRIGKLFRLALPKHSITVEEVITAMSWDDVYGNPYGITVNLAEEEDTTVTFLHETEATGTSTSLGGGGGGGKKQDDVWKEFRTGIDKTDRMLDLWARRYDQTEKILQQAGLYIDVNGTLNYAQDLEKGLYTQIQTKANEINASVRSIQEGLQAEIKVEKNRISQVVSAVGADGKVTAASIVAAVNRAGSSVQISADKINLSGNVSLNDVMSVSGSSVHIKRTTIFDAGGTNLVTISGGGIGIHGQMLKVANAEVSGNNLTITYIDGSKKTFSKATTLRGTWSGSTWTVTASPQNVTDVIQIGQKDHNTIGIARVGSETWLGTFEHGQWDLGYQAGWDAAPKEAHTNSRSLTYSRTEELPSGTMRYHYYTTGNPIHTSGSRTVYW